MYHSGKISYRNVRLILPFDTITSGIQCTYITRAGYGLNFTYSSFEMLDNSAHSIMQKVDVEKSQFATYYDVQENVQSVLQMSSAFAKILNIWGCDVGPAGTSLEGLKLNVNYDHTCVSCIKHDITISKHMMDHFRMYANYEAREIDGTGYEHVIAGLIPPSEIEKWNTIIYSSKACKRLIDFFDGMGGFFHRVVQHCGCSDGIFTCFANFYCALKMCALDDNTMLFVSAD